ncbi:MAG: hypothetical protein ACJZ33_04380 [Candidatus Poseidoniales archaeon]
MRKMLALIVCTLFLAGSSNAELSVETYTLELEAGDYVKYEIMGDTLGVMIGKDIGGDNYLGIENFIANEPEQKVTGQEIIEKGNLTYDCHIEKINMSLSFTLLLKENTSATDNDKMNFDISHLYTVWKVDTLTKIKQDYELNYHVDWLEDGEIKSYDMVMIDEISYNNRQGSWPGTIELNSTWTISETTKTSSTIRERVDEGEWETETEETEETVVTDFIVTDEVKVTTSAGTFEALKVKYSEQEDDAGTYSLEYYNSDFISVKQEEYEADELFVTMQLKEYSINSLESESVVETDTPSDNPLPSLTIVPALAVISLMSLLRRKV